MSHFQSCCFNTLNTLRFRSPSDTVWYHEIGKGYLNSDRHNSCISYGTTVKLVLLVSRKLILANTGLKYSPSKNVTILVFVYVCACGMPLLMALHLMNEVTLTSCHDRKPSMHLGLPAAVPPDTHSRHPTFTRTSACFPTTSASFILPDVQEAIVRLLCPFSAGCSKLDYLFNALILLTN